ncbi:unnamed protein product [Rangifer tarandus platyrhynchus]|uniref:Uncharacterized protein n=1 Tax=Rangifer tarandus platyrhynchus TaxID=3082113 RepID=A0ABN9A4F9_RANTA|nr:unnamed protein product [Rangifer tarandus platyrhynchus]
MRTLSLDVTPLTYAGSASKSTVTSVGFTTSEITKVSFTHHTYILFLPSRANFSLWENHSNHYHGWDRWLDSTPSFLSTKTSTLPIAVKSKVSFYNIEMSLSIFDEEPRISITSVVKEFAKKWLH